MKVSKRKIRPWRIVEIQFLKVFFVTLHSSILLFKAYISVVLTILHAAGLRAGRNQGKQLCIGEAACFCIYRKNKHMECKIKICSAVIRLHREKRQPKIPRAEAVRTTISVMVSRMTEDESDESGISKQGESALHKEKELHSIIP